ncbi:sirohydrochlorin chelatase [Virgibacillus necropolis]|uniref:Sirohydrochlorin chelatase n=1 Tax=Virgibacillus necropolis TaxID=163877 RepID=A0A221MGK6_9BACI|nr:sirohydrochlorin chelatase [Virgibacillus necropolis]ASN06793.1 sirohydrochlorin chelatase [Virgibacillus necropolis]
MQGVLYVSHGSRISEATSEAVTCITSVQQQVEVPLQEICFLELAEPDVEQGIDNLVNQGASRISIVPVLLLSAGHYYKDIPEEVNQAKLKYPSITFTYGRPLGVQDRFINILAQRIEETTISVKPDAKILLVGRGSRNPQTKIDIENVGGKLQRKTNVTRVDVCFLAACDPSFEQAIQSSLKEEHSQIFIVPYLWFTGVLLRSIEKEISELTNSNKNVVLCRQLGDHPIIKRALKERVYESFKKGVQK